MRKNSNGNSQMNRPVTLKTLGEYLGLSASTVSLALSNAPGVRAIPQKTRDRVTAAAKKFGFQPSFYARSLRKRQTFLIGVLVPELSDGYSVLVMDGIEQVVMGEGYFYLTASHRRKADLVEEYSRVLMNRSVEGFIAIDTAIEKAPPLPVVAVSGHRRIEGITNVVLNHRMAADLALQHLHGLGHRQIAFMKGQTFSSDSGDRWKGMMAAAKRQDLEVRPELVIQLQANLSSPELGYPVVGQLLAQGRKFTALVCFNDISAIGAIRALCDHGLRVPEDVSVVGFDDIQGAAYLNPRLTTIRQPLGEMGATAARILLKRIRGIKDYPQRVEIDPELMIRESTSAPGKPAHRPLPPTGASSEPGTLPPGSRAPVCNS